MKYLILLLALSFSVSVQAQYFQFSQYNLTPARTNIANVAMDNFQRVNFIYRNQSTAGDFNINSSSVSYQRPFRKKGSGKRWGGFGLDILDDRSAINGLLNKQRINCSWALNVNTAENQSLTLGVSARIKTQRISIDKLTTGSQYVAGRGFVPVFPKNENINLDRKTSFGLNASILYQNVDENENRKNHFGLSFFDLNEPRESVFKNDKLRLSPTAILEFGMRILKSDLFHAYPNVLVTYSASNFFLNTGVTWNLDLTDAQKLNAFNSISVLTNYVIGSYAIAGIQLHKDQYTFGFSYDIGLGKTIAANSSAVEVTFVWKDLIEVKPRKPRKVKPTKIKDPKVKKEKEKKVKNKKEKPTKVKKTKVKKAKAPKVKKEKEQKEKKEKSLKVKSTKIKKEKIPKIKEPKVKKEKEPKIKPAKEPKPKKIKKTKIKKEKISKVKTKKEWKESIEKDSIVNKEEIKIEITEEEPIEKEFEILVPIEKSLVDTIAVQDESTIENLNNQVIIKKDSLITSAEAGKIIYNAVEIEKVNISFEFELNKSDLLTPVKEYLEDLTTILIQENFLNIEIIGHTDRSGSEVYNLELSERRAEAIQNYLIKLGIPANRISSQGKGEMEPIKGASPEQNRRVEIYIFR